MGIELTWAERDLRSLDSLNGEIVVCSMFAEERPPHGVAGLIDWRLGGRLSRLCLDQFLTGRDRELLLIPGRPRVSFDKIVVVGLGERASFDEARFEDALARTLRALVDLQVRRVTIDLPGRHASAIDATRALTILATRVGLIGDAITKTELEAITLVDDADAQRAWIEIARTRRR